MRRRVFAAVFLVVIAALFSVVLAQSGQFDLPWHSVESGGGTSGSGDFALRGAIGQTDSGSLSGGDFTVGGGFMALPVPGGGGSEAVFLPLVMKPG